MHGEKEETLRHLLREMAKGCLVRPEGFEPPTLRFVV
jgi:hypothetical protein